MKNDIASKLGVTILCIVLLAGFARAQTNLVGNSGFEAGPTGQGQFTAWSWLGPADNFSNYGVAKSTAAFEVAEQGTNFAYFRGHPTDNSQDCLGTDVALKVGGLYTISYYLGTDGPLTNGAAMWVVIGTSFGINLSVDTMLTAFFPNSASALPYQKFNTNYVPATTGQILSFHGINATNGIAVTNGILLDNVSVVLAYPPLNINRSGPGSLVFTWPFTNTVYRLQTNASLRTTNWGTLSNLPTAVGATNQVILPAPAGTLFYRLTLP
ncbi:MAG TPA: hypothetical protein VK815_06690 [Candidatus Acidoferrales bacterium]|jgi:hypothetical protein|nr:hypothetical protein [Candidatus Acidoferrales bacterium]